MARPRGKYWQWGKQPIERTPPFVFIKQADGQATLIAPFPKRPRGPTPEEAALVRDVAGRLMLDLPVGACWIDPQDGTATAAAIGDGQLRRRLIDNASFEVRMA